jgi:hypothetical protein
MIGITDATPATTSLALTAHPGILASTGITFSTGPSISSEGISPWIFLYTPPVYAHAPTATTNLGSGIAS